MRNSKKVAVAGGTILALTAGGVAVAYWTTSGTGTGAGTTAGGNATALTVSDDTAPVNGAGGLSPMYPGDSVQPIHFTVKNNATESYKVSTVTAYLTVAGGQGSCSPADYTFNGAEGVDSAHPQILTFTPTELAKDTTAGGTTSIKFFANSAANQNGCKGATVTVHYAAS